MNSSLCPCNCSSEAAVILQNSSEAGSVKPPSYAIATSAFDVSVKEVFILTLFFVLLLYAIVSFLTQWNKNYREINHLPYYEIYIEESPQLTGWIQFQLEVLVCSPHSHHGHSLNCHSFGQKIFLQQSPREKRNTTDRQIQNDEFSKVDLSVKRNGVQLELE